MRECHGSVGQEYKSFLVHPRNGSETRQVGRLQNPDYIMKRSIEVFYLNSVEADLILKEQVVSREFYGDAASTPIQRFTG